MSAPGEHARSDASCWIRRYAWFKVGPTISMRTLAITGLVLTTISVSCSAPRYVRFKKDTIVPEDAFFAEGHWWRGRVERGSICKESFRKGAAVYIECPLVIHEDRVEEAEKQ